METALVRLVGHILGCVRLRIASSPGKVAVNPKPDRRSVSRKFVTWRYLTSIHSRGRPLGPTYFGGEVTKDFSGWETLDPERCRKAILRIHPDVQDAPVKAVTASPRNDLVQAQYDALRIYKLQ